ncbi:MAG: helix-turn-helix transcriptional regulator [Nannocystaceae bacterium]|nr:helix-turn-helix transcriptional regulator [Nannocystaceae bacterium]
MVGDRWSLVLLRDVLLHGTVRCSQLKNAAERISTNILTDRLRQLEAAGLLIATLYQDRPLGHRQRQRQRLTAAAVGAERTARQSQR